MCVCNPGHVNPGHVNIYDSPIPSLLASLVRQLCCLLQTKETQLTVNMMHIQTQTGGSDCGCFAIASATALCHGQNPSSLIWIQSKMQQHLSVCLTNRRLTPFPSKKSASKNSSNVKQTCTFPVFCSCRMPADRKGMLRCIQCTEWCAATSHHLHSRKVYYGHAHAGCTH